MKIDDLPLELNALIHSFKPYKTNFDKVVKEIIRFDVRDHCIQNDGDHFYRMTWKGKYTDGYNWVRGTHITFKHNKQIEPIQVCSLTELINFINGETFFKYANGRFGEKEDDYRIDIGHEYTCLIGNMELRDELIRVDKIAKRHHVTQWWV